MIILAVLTVEEAICSYALVVELIAMETIRKKCLLVAGVVTQELWLTIQEADLILVVTDRRNRSYGRSTNHWNRINFRMWQ
jgi:hypothetical protein